MAGFARFKLLGPGILFAIMAIGRTHIVLLPSAGAYWGFSLIWVMVLAYVFTYPYYEFGIRYVGATGESILSAWTRFKTRGSRKWVLAFMALGAFAITPLLFATCMSILGSTTISLMPWFPGHYNGAVILWAALSALLVVAGGYKGLEWVSKGFVAILVAVFVAAFLVKPPAMAAVAGGLLPKALPLTALAFIVPMMALPSSPADVVFMSSWIAQKKGNWQHGEEKSQRQIFKQALFDFRFGWIVIFIVGFLTFSLGATVLYPSNLPVGLDAMMVISNIFTTTIGQWTLPVFMLGVLIAIWSTAVVAVDGMSRVLGVAYHSMKGAVREVSHFSAPRVFSICWTVGIGMLSALFYQEPIFLTIIAGMTYLLMYPVCYGIQIWVVKNLIAEQEFKPSRFLMNTAWVGLVWVIIGMILTGYLFASGLKVY